MIGENIETPYKRWVIDDNKIRNPVRKKRRCSIVFLQKRGELKRWKRTEVFIRLFFFSSSKVSKLIPTRKQQKHFFESNHFSFLTEILSNHYATKKQKLETLVSKLAA